jgi:hypothetical protein
MTKTRRKTRRKPKPKLLGTIWEVPGALVGEDPCHRLNGFARFWEGEPPREPAPGRGSDGASPCRNRAR